MDSAFLIRPTTVLTGYGVVATTLGSSIALWKLGNVVAAGFHYLAEKWHSSAESREWHHSRRVTCWSRAKDHHVRALLLSSFLLLSGSLSFAASHYVHPLESAHRWWVEENGDLAAYGHQQLEKLETKIDDAIDTSVQAITARVQGLEERVINPFLLQEEQRFLNLTQTIQNANDRQVQRFVELFDTEGERIVSAVRGFNTEEVLPRVKKAVDRAGEVADAAFEIYDLYCDSVGAFKNYSTAAIVGGVGGALGTMVVLSICFCMKRAF